MYSLIINMMGPIHMIWPELNAFGSNPGFNPMVWSNLHPYLEGWIIQCTRHLFNLHESSLGLLLVGFSIVAVPAYTCMHIKKCIECNQCTTCTCIHWAAQGESFDLPTNMYSAVPVHFTQTEPLLEQQTSRSLNSFYYTLTCSYLSTCNRICMCKLGIHISAFHATLKTFQASVPPYAWF